MSAPANTAPAKNTRFWNEGFIGRYRGSSIHQSGKSWVKEGFGSGKHLGNLGRALGIGFTAFTAYEGYKEGGVWGAAKSVGEMTAMNYLFGAGLKAVGLGASTLGAAVLIGAPVAWGVTQAVTGKSPLQLLSRPRVREHLKKHAKLEMGRPVMDQFGTVSTMRQRSLMAIQNSKVNGRSALGNEAALTYRPSYFR